MSSYPKIYNVGHPALDEFFDTDKVIVEEKVDGSQLSFGVFNGELLIRSRGANIYTDSPHMFSKAVDTVEGIRSLLVEGYMYRAEYLSKPKHNALAYDRVPDKNIILFDVATGPERYGSRELLEIEAVRLGLEVVPVLAEKRLDSANDVRDLLDTVSVLGGQKVEGLVFKRRDDPLYGRDGKPLIAKFVSEAFREIHKSDWKRESKKDLISTVVDKYRSDARFHKAVQHMAEDGTLLREPKDIGQLIKSVQQDVIDECEDEIKQMIFDYYRKTILRGVIRGLPEWYKGQLLEGQFNETHEEG